MERTRLAYVTAAAVGVSMTVFFTWRWWKREKPRPPSKWRKVGELSDLVAFPIKSLGPVRLNSMECTMLGLKSGWMRDRTLMVIDLDGRFITARKLPKLVQVSPSYSGSVLSLQAPDMMPVSVDLAQVYGKSFQVTVWDQDVPARDCGDEVARWLSQFIFQEDTGLRLVYYSLDWSVRSVEKKHKALFPEAKRTDTGAYSDTISYSLINEASVADLNTRLDEPITPQQFRMNFTIKGPTAYEEDKWDWIKIGDLIMKNILPCTRCVLTTIDPKTGTKNLEMEPLKTLKSYRQITDPAMRAVFGESPVMGIHLGLRGPSGTIHLGDPVYVGIPDEPDVPPLTSPS